MLLKKDLKLLEDYNEDLLTQLFLIKNKQNNIEKENIKLQQRIDKAIEYIKKEYKFIDINTGEITYTKGGKDLLEILGGEENGM